MNRPPRLPVTHLKGRALETLALAPVALGALLSSAGAAEARGADSADLKAGASAVVGLEEAMAMGRAQLKAGRVVEALQAYNQALSRAPESIEVLNAVAVCYDRMGKFDTSRTYYETALGIDPQSPLLLNNYGYSLYLQGDRTEATRFLALAVAMGDADVQATAMRILAKIEAEDRAAPARASAQTPLVQQATAEVPRPTPGQPQVIRTSAHEVRLVLGDAPAPAASAPRHRAPQPAAAPQPVAPAILADVLGPDAAAILPVVALSAAEDRMIAEADAAAIRREAVVAAVHAQREVQSLSAAQAAAVPAMMQAMIDLAFGARPVPVAISAPVVGPFAPSRPSLPEAADQEWDRHQLLVATAPRNPGPARAVRQAAPGSLVVAAIVPSKPVARAPDAATLAAAEPVTRKRAFEQPFASDDERLNGFARRLHGGKDTPAVDEQIARLQALIARTANT